MFFVVVVWIILFILFCSQKNIFFQPNFTLKAAFDFKSEKKKKLSCWHENLEGKKKFSQPDDD